MAAGGSSFGEIIVKFGADISGFVSGAGVVVAALAGIGLAVAESVKSAGDFQMQLTKLYTTAGESKANLQMVGDGILAMSTSVGTGAHALGDAMYWIESGGAHGAVGLEDLRVAAQGAKAENANLNDVSRALMATLNAYSGTGLTAAGAMNTLIASTGQGMMTLEELSTSLANVLPATAKFHIGLTDVGAAMATMTMQGDPAASAATHLRQMILALEAPSKIGAAALKSVGLTSQEVSQEMTKSLPSALQMITDAVGKKFPEGSAAYNQAIKNIAGGSRQMMGFLELTGTHLQTFKDKVDLVSKAVKEGGNNVMGWADVQANFNFKMDAAKAAIESLGIKLGTILLPALSGILTAITPLILRFAEWISTGDRVKQFLDDSSPKMVILKIALIALAGVIGGILVGAFVSLAVAAWAALLPLLPFIAVCVAIALVVAGIIFAITHWGEIMKWIGGIFSSIGSDMRKSATQIKNDVGGMFSSLGTDIRNSLTKIKNDVGGIFSSLGTDLRNSATKIKNDVGGVFSSLGKDMHDSITKIKNDVGAIFSGLGTIAHNAGQAIIDAGQWMYNHNYYWKDAADGIGKTFSDLGTQLRQSMAQIKSDVGPKFDDLGTQMRQSATQTKNDVTAQFNDMGTQMRQSATQTHNDVGAQFNDMGTQLRQSATQIKNDVGAQFNDMGTQLRQSMTAIKNDITDKIGQAVGNFMSSLGTLASGVNAKMQEVSASFSSAMTGIINSAFAGGASVVQGIIDGISSKLGALAGMAGQAAAVVKSFLGFHSPTEKGPGTELNQWGPALVKGFADGIDASAPMLRSAVDHLMTFGTYPLKIGANGVMSDQFSGSGTTGRLSVVGGNSVGTIGGGNGQDVTINLNIDGRTLASALGPFMANELRINLGVRR